MFNKIKMRTIIIYLIVIMLGSFTISIFLGIRHAESWHFGDKLSGIVDMKSSLDLDNIEKIHIKAVSSEINIFTAEGNQVEVCLQGKDSLGAEPYLVTDTSENRISIVVKHKRRIFFTAYPHTKLDIYIPSEYMKAVEVETISSDVIINKINLSSFNFVTSSGSLKADILNTTEAVLNTKSGNVAINQYSGKLDFESSSGSLDISYPVLNGDLTAYSTAGNINIKLPSDSEFFLKAEYISGKLNSDFSILVNESGMHNIAGSVGHGGYNINVKTIAGSINLYNLEN